MRVRWVTTRSGKAIHREVDFDTQFDLALVKFIQANNDPYVEAVELLEDKGEESRSRGDFVPQNLRDLAKWMNRKEED